MPVNFDQCSPQFLARLAGVLYLLVVPTGIFSLIYVPSQVYVSGDPSATAKSILASETLFRLGVVSDQIGSLLMICVVLVLYRLLRHVNKDVARLMVILVVIAVPIVLLNGVNQLGALRLLSGSSSLAPFATEQLEALAFHFLIMQKYGTSVAFIFWGGWLLPLGYLIIRSGFLPKFLGILLLIAGLGYFADSFGNFLGFNVGVGIYTGWGEIVFLIWLLVRGINLEEWQIRECAVD